MIYVIINSDGELLKAFSDINKANRYVDKFNFKRPNIISVELVD